MSKEKKFGYEYHKQFTATIFDPDLATALNDIEQCVLMCNEDGYKSYVELDLLLVFENNSLQHNSTMLILKNRLNESMEVGKVNNFIKLLDHLKTMQYNIVQVYL